MDLSKYLIEKLFSFIAGIIPGFVVLLIYHLAVPGSFGWFFSLSFLGYKAKIAVILVTAFVIGNSMTTFLRAMFVILGAIIGSVRGQKEPIEPAYLQKHGPWRDVRWRSILKAKLGPQSPNDTAFLFDGLLALKRQAIENLPAGQRPLAHAALNKEKSDTDMDDFQWAQWYDHYHYLVCTRDSPDVRWQVHVGLSSNLEAAAVYVLLSATIVPAVRHWWCILPSCMWVFLLIAQEYSGFKKVTDKWSTLSEQIRYLSDSD